MKNKNQSQCCCFTGHRPEKLIYSENEIKILLEKAIDNAIANGYSTFITGMAPGTDIYAAEIVPEKKKYNASLHLICAIPHPGFEKRKNKHDEERYQNILKKADYIKIICNHYFKGCYQRRNEFMVDHSNLVIAIWNGLPSGTKNCIDYAERKGINVINLLDLI